MASTQKKGTNPAFVGTASMNAETISSTVNSKLTAVKLSSSFAQKSINAGLADSKSAPFVASTTTTALLGNEEYQSHALQNLNIGAVSTAGTGQEASISESLVMNILFMLILDIHSLVYLYMWRISSCSHVKWNTCIL
ncbi:hypothetical protein MT418_002609 [Batrachochytrium dendrobatidis]